MQKRVRAALLDFFDRHARDLPFRRTKDPYAIWVSEVMAQQTRIETVVPYFERFVRRFPTLEALADASEDAVLAAFSGLGYYRRARLLHAGAKEIVARHGGEVPRDADTRRALPGVGRYTSGAIGSIAFDLPEPTVDGNVARVFARIHRIALPLGSAAMEKRLWAEAEALVAGERPGDLNQALMELGATVCTPRAPRCDACPVRFACGAHRHGEADELPIPKKRRAPTHKRILVVVARDAHPSDPSVVLFKGERALFGGLHGLPTVERSGDDQRDARAALASRGITSRKKARLHGSFVHALSHLSLEVEVASVVGVSASEQDLHPRSALGSIGLSTLTRRALEQSGFLEPPPRRSARRARG
jgi:A/G-specific adenine glycosylase